MLCKYIVLKETGMKNSKSRSRKPQPSIGGLCEEQAGLLQALFEGDRPFIAVA